MQIKDVKINPMLVKPLMETLDKVKEDKRGDYIGSLLDQVEEDIGKAQDYAKSNGVRYEAAISKVQLTRPLASFCKDGC